MATDPASIKNADDLKQWFFENRKFPKRLNKGMNVSSKVRKETMLSSSQGNIVLNGRFRSIQFENLIGGVYRAYLEVEYGD